MQQSSGPIPPPEMLAGYERALAGAADRILRMAEVQSEHRQGLENTALRGQLAGQARGTYCGLAAVVTVLGLPAL